MAMATVMCADSLRAGKGFLIRLWVITISRLILPILSAKREHASMTYFCYQEKFFDVDDLYQINFIVPRSMHEFIIVWLW